MNHRSEADDAAAAAERQDRRSDHFALEFCFLALVGVVVLLAFLEALSYKLVSSRTPFVIMAPLFVLIVVHARRLWRVREQFDFRARVAIALSGRSKGFNTVLGFSGWMVGLVVMITILGHYAGIFLFCLILMRFLAAETWTLSLAVAAATTLFVYGVFEFLFNIDLYRGLIVRYFLGFRDF